MNLLCEDNLDLDPPRLLEENATADSKDNRAAATEAANVVVVYFITLKID